MEAVYIAVASAISALASLLIAGWVQSRAKRSEAEIRHQERLDEATIKAADRDAEWARQDKVADRLAAATAAAAAQVEEIARKQDGVAKTTDKKLDQIHTLVNSHMTLAMENELTAYKALLALLRRQPNDDDGAAIAVTEAQIAKLESDLMARAEAEEKAAAQMDRK